MKLLEFIAGIFKPATELIDDLVTSKEEKMLLVNKLEEIRNSLTEKLLDYEIKLAQMKSDIVKSETVGSWLQRSWRPLLMLSFGLVLLYEYFFSSIFSLPKAGLPQEFWELLKLGVGGYIVGRSAEKIIPQTKLGNKKES